MLLKCPECQLQVSDKALTCPHCGYPLKTDSGNSPPRKKSKTKRKRLPNGFGQISEIKNQNLRKPFRAMVTVGKTSTGKPICKILKPEGYFETYNDAYEALMEYNRNPYDLDVAMTVKELYERWSAEYLETLKSPSSRRTITNAWSYCSSIYDMRAMDVRARHIKGVIDEGFVIGKDGAPKYPTAGVKSRIKSMFNLMLDYAVEYEIVDRNYARTFNLADEIIAEQAAARRGHIPFSDEEMALLWKNLGQISWVDVVLIQCYTGWRPQELGLIEVKDIDLQNWTMRGGMKTQAGYNRLVPIHPRIRSLVVDKYQQAQELGSDYLINCTDGQTHVGSLMFTYDKYQQRFAKIVSRLNLNPDHRAHDPRVHFVTQCKKYNVDEYAIKYMVGHAINDITEKVYTKRDVEWFMAEIQKIK